MYCLPFDISKVYTPKFMCKYIYDYFAIITKILDKIQYNIKNVLNIWFNLCKNYKD